MTVATTGLASVRMPARLFWLWVAWLVALLVMFRDTGASMVSIWWHSETFMHAFLVPPISAWLAWRLRDELARLPSAPQPWALVPLAGAALLWLAGELATVQSASQLALVTMLVLTVPVCFGLRVAKALIFPLAFLYFSVPFGEFLVPMLMELTADFTVLAVQQSGVPVYREGLSFVIPSGRWSVVEACSGIRYLIASFMVGSLYAYLNYRSPGRRLVFAVVSLIVPVLANWVRAYLIVMLGHHSGNQLAVGVDHLVYGWVFFGIVIGLMFAIGARWAEPDGAPDTSASLENAPPEWVPRSAWRAVAAGVLLCLAPIGYLAHLVASPDGAAPVVEAPQALAGGWQLAADRPEFQPDFTAPRAVWSGRFRRGSQSVSVWIGYYRHQGDGHKLVSSVNRLVDPKDEHWSLTAQSSRLVPAARDAVAWRTAVLRPTNLMASPSGASVAREVWQTYWVGGRLTPSDARAKLWTAWNQLLGRGDDGVAILIHADGEDAAGLGAFAEVFVPAILPVLERASAAD
jgi:exosortase A